MITVCLWYKVLFNQVIVLHTNLILLNMEVIGSMVIIWYDITYIHLYIFWSMDYYLSICLMIFLLLQGQYMDGFRTPFVIHNVNETYQYDYDQVVTVAGKYFFLIFEIFSKLDFLFI